MMKEKFISYMQDFCPLPSKIAIAVSGGSDSLALVLLAHEWAKESGTEIVGLTVDHNLREEAKEEAQQVARWLEAKNIKHHTLTNKDPNKPESNIMEYAREARYQLLTDWCKENNIESLMVAHHAEDQAETFLLRLERGSGVDGLSAMQPETIKNSIRVLRPLLSCSKKGLQTYLRTQNQEWIEDPTNEKLEFKRNSLRKVLSELEDTDLITNRLNKTANIMARAREALDFYTDQFLIENLEFYDAGYAILNIQSINHIPEEIAFRALKNILCNIAGIDRIPRFEELERFYKQIQQPNFAGCTLWGCKIEPYKNNQLLFLREQSKIAPHSSLNTKENLLWDKRQIISFNEVSNLTDLNITIFSHNEISPWIKSLSETEQKRIANIIPKEVLTTIPFFVPENMEMAVENCIAAPHIEYYKDSRIKSALSCKFRPVMKLPKGSFDYCSEQKYALT